MYTIMHQLGRINGTYKEESSLKGVSGENKHTIGRPKVNLLTIDELKNELINYVINWLKEEDSELWFVKNEIRTRSIGQRTYLDLFKKSGPRRILFYKSCLCRILK